MVLQCGCVNVGGDRIMPEGYILVEMGISSWYFCWRVMSSGGVNLVMVGSIVWF